MVLKEGIEIERRCQTCQGDGVIIGASCNICGQVFSADDPWWDSDNTGLPCGHATRELEEHNTTCPECGGTGRSKQRVSAAEWQRMRRNRVVRGLMLLLAVVILIMALAWVMFSR